MIMEYLVFLGVAVVAFAVIYGLVHRMNPNLGRIIASLSMGLYSILDISGSLPWASVLDGTKAALVGFAIALGNAVLKTIDNVTKPGTPAA